MFLCCAQCSSRRLNQNADGEQRLEQPKRHAPEEINYKDPGREYKNTADSRFWMQFLCFLIEDYEEISNTLNGSL